MHCYDMRHCLHLAKGRLKGALCKTAAAREALSHSEAHALCQENPSLLKGLASALADSGQQWLDLQGVGPLHELVGPANSTLRMRHHCGAQLLWTPMQHSTSKELRHWAHGCSFLALSEAPAQPAG